VRLAEVAQVLVRHGFADLVRRVGLYEGAPAKLLRSLHLIEQAADVPETMGARLRAAFTELGPTFVKFGQILSTRPDVLGPDICAELSNLQDNVTALPFESMRPVIEGELGGKLEDYFREFNKIPVASASLSQVYHAWTQLGREVAVKVQRPGIRKTIQSDISLMRGLAEWIAEHVKELHWIDPVGTVEEFHRTVIRELDFTIEAQIIQRFRKNYSGEIAVFVPRVENDISGPRMLVMDWIDGARVDALHEYEMRNCSPRTVAANGANTLCRQVFEFHLFHADPHPGNILVTRNDQIAFLDYGMVGHLEPHDVDAMADLLRAVFEEDSIRCVDALLKFTITGETEHRPELEHDVAQYIAFEARSVMGNADVGKTLDQVTNILRRHKLQLAPRFSLLLKAMATIESTAKTLDKTLDMGPIIHPYVEDIIKQRFAPIRLAKEGQQSLATAIRFGKEIPSEILSLVRTVRKGKFRIQLDHEGLDHLANVTDRASNRIAFSVIAGALIVGSSLLISSDVGARSLGYAGFSFAGVLGVMLLISILRSKNY
jgi:ubiquinone biosynthesis protein